MVDNGSSISGQDEMRRRLNIYWKGGGIFLHAEDKRLSKKGRMA